MGEPVRDFSPEDRQALGQAVLSLLDDWGLDSERQAIMLGLDAGNPLTIEALRAGASLPKVDDVLERASRFLNLGLLLNALHNYESEWLQDWMVLANEDLGGQSPYDFIREYGITGLAWLEDHLAQQQADRPSEISIALDTAG